MSLQQARRIVVAASNNVRMIGITQEMIKEAFYITTINGDFILDGVLYKNVAEILANR